MFETRAWWLLCGLAALMLASMEAAAHASHMSCANSASWERGRVFGEMGIPTYSPSTTACTLTISSLSAGAAAVTTYTPNQEYSVTITANEGSMGMKAVLVGGAIIQSPGAGGFTTFSSTCVNYDDRAGSRTFTFRAPQSNTNLLHIRALCGTESRGMFVATPITLSSADGLPPSTTNDENGGAEEAYEEEEGLAVKLKPVLAAHIIIMLMAFGFLLPWAVQIPVFNNAWRGDGNASLCGGLKYSWWVAIHRALAASAFALAVVGLAVGVISSANSETHFTSTHTQLGLACICLCFLQVLAGCTRRLWKKSFAQVHAVMGAFTLVLGFVSLFYGVVELEEYTGGLPHVLGALTGSAGFTGSLGIAVIVIVAWQLFVLGLGLLQRALLMRRAWQKSKRFSLPREYTMDEVNASRFLFVYNSCVLDLQAFLPQHPGGERVLVEHMGRDISTSFERVGHSQRARTRLQSLVVGTLAHGAKSEHETHELMLDAAAPPSSQVFLTNPSARHRVLVLEKVALTHNVYAFTLGFEPAHLALGLPVCKHIQILARSERSNEEFARKYTPIEQGQGWFKLVIKIYRPNAALGFPLGGEMGAILDRTRVGDELIMAGPFGREEYLGHGRFKLQNQRAFTHLICLAGGSGITPIYQLARAILGGNTTGTGGEDSTSVHILSCNSTPQDVILRNELEAMHRLHLWFTVSKLTNMEGEVWPYSVGRISRALLQHCFSTLPRDSSLVIICGPRAFVQHCRELVRGDFANVMEL